MLNFSPDVRRKTASGAEHTSDFVTIYIGGQPTKRAAKRKRPHPSEGAVLELSFEAVQHVRGLDNPDQ